MKNGESRDFRKKLTDALIASIEENDGMPWQQGWHDIRPFNPGTGVKYKGGNVVNLMVEQLKLGSDDPRWMTFKQANAAGYHIRKGAKATHIEYWDFGQTPSTKREVDAEGKDIKSDETLAAANAELLEKRRRPGVFFPAVFNGADIIGLPELKREIKWQPNDLADRLIRATGAKIDHAVVSRVGRGIVQNSAFYSHQNDRIVVPPKSSFKSDSDYYATILHEIAHWTGHQTRLNRHAPDETQPPGSPAYAKEELRADIASMFLCSMLGMEGKIQNHAKYVESWLQALKSDKHEIFRAARDAEVIVDYLFDLAPELRNIVDGKLTENLLPKDGPKKTIKSGISQDLPNFIPANAPKAPVGIGRNDPRWPICEKAIRDEAKKYSIGDAAIVSALSLVESQFTDVMNAAENNGYDADDMSTMLARNIVDEMRTADVRQQQWEKFCNQVREFGGEHPVEHIEAVLQELGQHYQVLIGRSSSEGWSKQQTETAIREMIYGQDGRRPIDPDYVRFIVDRSEAVKGLSIPGNVNDDDEFVLRPIGLTGEIPDDPGVVNDEFIVGGQGGSIMEDAETMEPSM